MTFISSCVSRIKKEFNERKTGRIDDEEEVELMMNCRKKMTVKVPLRMMNSELTRPYTKVWSCSPKFLHQPLFLRPTY